MTSEQQIEAFKNEIFAAIPFDEIDRLEDLGASASIRREAEVVALYLARSWHFDSPWWADEALRKIFTDGLPVTNAARTAHARAADLRLADKCQNKSVFLRQAWEDRAFFLSATMREAGVSAKEASEQAARWRDEFSAGAFTAKASTIERNYPKWADDPLRGRVWCGQLSQVMEGLTSAEKADLIQCNKLRARMLPPCPEGLRGNRRD
jgi:hypothetical protein